MAGGRRYGRGRHGARRGGTGSAIFAQRAPRQFTQLARNPERSVEIGGSNQVFAAVYGPPFVRDLEGGRRYGDIESFQNLVRLIYQHPNLHHGSFVVCEPCDVPVSKRHLDMLHAHMTLSDKPHFGAITEKGRAQDSVDMAEIVFGRETMDEHCVILGNVNTNSPLLVDKVVTESIRVYCGRGRASPWRPSSCPARWGRSRLPPRLPRPSPRR